MRIFYIFFALFFTFALPEASFAGRRDGNRSKTRKETSKSSARRGSKRGGDSSRGRSGAVRAVGERSSSISVAKKEEVKEEIIAEKPVVKKIKKSVNFPRYSRNLNTVISNASAQYSSVGSGVKHYSYSQSKCLSSFQECTSQASICGTGFSNCVGLSSLDLEEKTWFCQKTIMEKCSPETHEDMFENFRSAVKRGEQIKKERQNEIAKAEQRKVEAKKMAEQEARDEIAIYNLACGNAKGFMKNGKCFKKITVKFAKKTDSIDIELSETQPIRQQCTNEALAKTLEKFKAGSAKRLAIAAAVGAGVGFAGGAVSHKVMQNKGVIDEDNKYIKNFVSGTGKGLFNSKKRREKLSGKEDKSERQQKRLDKMTAKSTVFASLKDADLTGKEKRKLLKDVKDTASGEDAVNDFVEAESDVFEDEIDRIKTMISDLKGELEGNDPKRAKVTESCEEGCENLELKYLNKKLGKIETCKKQCRTSLNDAFGLKNYAGDISLAKGKALGDKWYEEDLLLIENYKTELESGENATQGYLKKKQKECKSLNYDCEGELKTAYLNVVNPDKLDNKAIRNYKKSPGLEEFDEYSGKNNFLAGLFDVENLSELNQLYNASIKECESRNASTSFKREAVKIYKLEMCKKHLSKEYKKEKKKKKYKKNNDNNITTNKIVETGEGIITNETTSTSGGQQSNGAELINDAVGRSAREENKSYKPKKDFRTRRDGDQVDNDFEKIEPKQHKLSKLPGIKRH